MNYNTIITNLYFLLIYADGNVNEREVTSARQMLRAENMSEPEFNVQMELLKSKDRNALLAETMIAMKKLDHQKQIRIVAWLCVVANADGFMERTEWQLIYKIYHKELSLPLSEIFAVQKDLNRIIWEQSTITIL
jgi:uncharacterized tellurite resistance protein B-like protein